MEQTNNTNNDFDEDVFDTPYQSAYTPDAMESKGKATFGHLSKIEYCKTFADKSLDSEIKWVGIACYIFAAINLLAIFLIGPTALIDALLLLGLGLGIHLRKSLVCSIILTLYGLFGVIMNIVLSGEIRGWMIPIAGIIGLIYTFRLDKQYKAYLAK